MVIHGASPQAQGEVAALLAVLSDPKAAAAKLTELKSAEEAARKASVIEDEKASVARAAEEAAKREQAKASSMKVDAEAILAGARKAEKAVATEAQANGERARTLTQERAEFEKYKTAAEKELRDAGDALLRREVSVKAREERAGKTEAEAQALKTEYQNKLEAFRKIAA